MVHDHDTIGRFGNHAHVVRDEHGSRAALFADLAQQRNDLRLHRYVKRGGGLVCNDEFWLGTQGQRNGYARAHAARKLVRVLRHALFGVRNFHLFQQRQGAGLGFFFRHWQVRANGFHQMVTHGVDRVQAGQRVLKDGANALAANAAQILSLQVVDTQAAKLYRATGDATGRFNQAGDGRARHGLACA